MPNAKLPKSMTTVPETQPTPGADPLVGMVLDRYRVLEKIGEGGMGAVYAVEHVMLQKRMAMKLLRAELSSNKDLVTRFQNEAVAAGRIGQENIVAVTDFGRTPDGLVYFVMEELHGKSLAEVIRAEGGLSMARTMGIAAQVCRALQAAHQAGIVHRDLKPENIILAVREGVVDFVKVLDFGIAKTTEQQPTGTRLTQVGMIVGTPEYMSPEQASGKHVDPRSDVYSLGVVLFEMLTGRLPFNGDNVLHILMKHQTEKPPTLAEARPGTKFSAAVELMIFKALSKRPEDRQQSMAECLGDLQRFADQLRMTQPELMLPPMSGMTPTDPISAARFPSNPPWVQPDWASPTTVTPAAVAPPEDPVGAGIEAASLRPKRWGLWLVLALVLLAGGGLGALALRGNSPAERMPAPTPTPLPVAKTEAPLLPPPAALPEPPAPPASDAPQPATAAAPRPVPATSGHTRRETANRAGPPSKPAAPSQSEPYQKMDDLKSAY